MALAGLVAGEVVAQAIAEGNDAEELARAEQIALVAGVKGFDLAAQLQQARADGSRCGEPALLDGTDRAFQEARRYLRGGLDVLIAERPDIRDARLEFGIVDIERGNGHDVGGDEAIEPGEGGGVEFDGPGRLRLVDDGDGRRRDEGEGRALGHGGIHGVRHDACGLGGRRRRLADLERVAHARSTSVNPASPSYGEGYSRRGSPAYRRFRSCPRSGGPGAAA